MVVPMNPAFVLGTISTVADRFPLSDLPDPESALVAGALAAAPPGPDPAVDGSPVP